MASAGSQSFSGGNSFNPFTATSGSLSSSFSQPSSSGYFNMDDILASQQKVPVQFETPVYRLGFLNPSANQEHLEVGLKMELPFWLAKVLQKRQIVNVELPRQYRRGQREILRADAAVVDLYKLGPHFYSMGMKILCFDHVESKDLSETLLETFLNRFRLIMDSSQNADEADLYALTSKLDETERILFRLGHLPAQQMELWEKGGSCKITSSLAVQASRKRKRRPSQ